MYVWIKIEITDVLFYNADAFVVIAKLQKIQCNPTHDEFFYQ